MQNNSAYERLELDGQARTSPVGSFSLSSVRSMLGSQMYELPDQVQKDNSLGAKTIGWFGSMVFVINNVAGPGMLAFPLCLQQAGWLFPVFCLGLIWIVCTLASTMLAEAMMLIPNNNQLQQRVEYATLVKHYFGNKAYWVTQLFYNLSLITVNVASILVTAQVLDSFLVFAFGKTFAVEVLPSPSFHSWDNNEVVPFYEEGWLVLTLGYLIVTSLFLPMGFMTLGGNIYFQYVSFTALVVILAELIVEFFRLGLDTSNVPLMGDPTSALGTVMFAFTFVVTIPSWCNEKKPNVNVNAVLWASTSFSVVCYLLIGFLSAWAFPNMTNSNVLDEISDDPRVGDFTRYCVYAFSLGVVGLGVPMLSIVVRYNLFVGEVCGKWASIFWGAIFPYLICWFFYQGEGFQIFVTWSSLLINGFINFVVPVAIYLKAKHIQFLLSQVNTVKSIQAYSPHMVAYANPDFDASADPNFAPHQALPSVIDDRYFVVLGVCIALGGMMTFLIVLNIITDLATL